MLVCIQTETQKCVKRYILFLSFSRIIISGRKQKRIVLKGNFTESGKKEKWGEEKLSGSSIITRRGGPILKI